MSKLIQKLGLTSLSFLLMLISLQSFSSPAYPGLVEFKQPDGTTLQIYMKGDEYLKWAETEDGYSLLYNDKGFYEYAMYNESRDLVPSGYIATDIEKRTSETTVFLSSIEKHLRYSTSQKQMSKQVALIKDNEMKKRYAFPTAGNRKLLCIMIAFTDKAFTKTQSDFNNLFNQVGYSAESASGSVKDYFKEASYGQLNLDVTVAGPFTAANNMAYYGANTNNVAGEDTKPTELITEAINAADASVNYADYDNDGDGSVDGVYVIYAGYGEEAGGGANTIWAHAYSLTSPLTKDGKSVSKYSCSCELKSSTGTTITRIGIICHEFGHVLGAPDYYDTDASTNGEYLGTGNWDLQAGGSWNGAYGNYGATPAHPNAYTKSYIYKWASPVTLNAAQTITLYNSAQNSNSFYRYNTATAGEYYLIENRQKVGFDAYLPGKGLIVYHVDSAHIAANRYSVNTGSHQGLYIKAATSPSASGVDLKTASTINSAGCPFPGTGSKTSFTDATTPNSKSWASASISKPITSISENTTNKTITLNFMGGYSCTTPTSQANTFSSSSLASNTMTISWNRGNGNAVLVVARSSNAVNNNPLNGVNYTANSAFGTGTKIGSDNYVVYNGSGTSVNLTNLVSGTTYYFAVYEYTSSSLCYNTSALTGSAATTGTVPCTLCSSVGSVPSTGGWYTSITGVSLNTISTTSAKSTGYDDYGSIPTTLTMNSTYPLTVKLNTDGNYKVTAIAWIDWNQDCDFNDAGESYALGSATNVTNGSTTASPYSITVPGTALTGSTRMRVSCLTGSTAPTSCQTGHDGEVEDYVINVVSGVCTPVAITSQPAVSQSVCAPGSATFTVAAGTGTDPKTYQWQFNNGTSWVSVANGTPSGAVYTGGTTASMSVTGINYGATFQYRCYVTNCSGANNATSNAATLIINDASVGGTVSGGSTICSGNTSAQLSVSGNTGNVTKWQYSVSPFSNWLDITSTSSTYTSGALTQTTQFRAVVQNATCSTANSTATTVTVDAASNGGSVNGATAVCSGNTSGTLSLSGNTGSVVKWQMSNNSTDWSDINSTSTSYTSGPLTQNTQFRAEVKNGTCNSAFSNPLNISILNATTSQITANACGQYQSPSGKIMTVTGQYKDTISNKANCDSIITIDLVIKENSFSSMDTTVCNSFITPSGKTVNSSGIFNDTISNNIQCDSIITINLTVDNCTNINSSNELNVTVYPNPATDLLNIDGAESANIEIFDLIGKQLIALIAEEEHSVINLNSLSNGFYFIKISKQNYQKVLKIEVQR